jgi:Formin Homology 2 Domain
MILWMANHCFDSHSLYLLPYVDFALLRQAGEEVMTSSSLRKILGLVLHLGNRVHGSPDTEARAITLASLAQLPRTPCGGSASFLECVVRLLQRHAPALLQNYRREFAQTLPQCQGISWKESWHELEAFHATVAALPSTAPVHLVDAAKVRLQEMEEPVQSTESVLDQLVHFFGEDAVHTFDTILPLLQQFCVDLDASIQRVQRQRS